MAPGDLSQDPLSGRGGLPMLLVWDHIHPWHGGLAYTDTGARTACRDLMPVGYTASQPPKSPLLPVRAGKVVFN